MDKVERYRKNNTEIIVKAIQYDRRNHLKIKDFFEGTKAEFLSEDIGYWGFLKKTFTIIINKKNKVVRITDWCVKENDCYSIVSDDVFQKIFTKVQEIEEKQWICEECCKETNTLSSCVISPNLSNPPENCLYNFGIIAKWKKK